jgi:hypothetical protein
VQLRAARIRPGSKRQHAKRAFCHVMIKAGRVPVRFSSVTRERVNRCFGILIATFLAGLLSSVGASAQTQASPPSIAPPAATVQPGAQRPSDREREDFLKSMSLMPLPEEGCFKAVYPNKIWQPAECAPRRAQILDRCSLVLIG